MHLPPSGVASNATVTAAHRSMAVPLPEERARAQPALRYRAGRGTGPESGLRAPPSLLRRTGGSQAAPSPATLRRAGRLRDGASEVHGQAPLPRSRTAPRTAPLLFSRLGLLRTEPPDLAEEWPARPGLRVRDQRREGPLSWTKTKARRAGGAHSLPRRSGPARPRLSPSSRASPGGRAGAAGPNLQHPAVGRAAGCGRAGGGTAAPARGTMGAEERPSGRRDSAGPASARPLVWRGPGAECGGGGLAQTRRAPGAC